MRRSAAGTLVDIIRHGLPEGGLKYRGSGIDDPLSAEGWRQMRAALQRTAPWSRVLTSPLRRCHEFAGELAAARDLPLQVEPDLREVGFGSWEGRSAEDLRREDAQAVARFYADPAGCRPSGAEPLDRFQRRVVGLLARLAEEHPGEHLLLVAHAGVIRAALCHVLGAPIGALYRIQVAHAGLSRIELHAGGRHLLLFHGRERL